MTTDRDYADKSWLREEDAFQIIPPDIAAFLVIVGLFVGAVFERFM